mgnify:CR=1 FL=1
MASACEISIILPVYNEAGKLLELLSSIRSLQLPNSEILLTHIDVVQEDHGVMAELG